jgi:Fur family ferric uptake transcriptional regulator
MIIFSIPAKIVKTAELVYQQNIILYDPIFEPGIKTILHDKIFVFTWKIIFLQHCCKFCYKLAIEELLKRHRLSSTTIREDMLKVFIESRSPISMNELKEKMKRDCDRVTLYRNLKSFTKKGILHEVYLDKQESRFVLPENILNPEMEYAEHLHFKCTKCDMVKCLTDQEIMDIALPEGFKMLEANFVVFGLCDNCNLNKQQ